MATFVQAGTHLDYTPGSDVTAGDVINLGTGLVGVASEDIPAGRLGSLTIGGIFEVANNGLVFAAGATVGYDATAKVTIAAGTGDFDLGPAAYAIGASDATGQVLLNGRNI